MLPNINTGLICQTSIYSLPTIKGYGRWKYCKHSSEIKRCEGKYECERGTLHPNMRAAAGKERVPTSPPPPRGVRHSRKRTKANRFPKAKASVRPAAAAARPPADRIIKDGLSGADNKGKEEGEGHADIQ